MTNQNDTFTCSKCGFPVKCAGCGKPLHDDGVVRRFCQATACQRERRYRNNLNWLERRSKRKAAAQYEP